MLFRSIQGSPGVAERSSRDDSRRYGPRPFATPLGMAGARFDVPSHSPKELPAPPPQALMTGARASSRSPRVYTARGEADQGQAQRATSPASYVPPAATSPASYVPPPSSLSLVPARRSDSFIPSGKADSFAPSRRPQGVPGQTTFVTATRSPSGGHASHSQSPRFDNRDRKSIV